MNSADRPWVRAWSGLSWPARAFILALAALAFGLLVHPLGDPDVFIHLRDGQYLWEHRLQAGTEPFAYTVPTAPFENAEWLFRVGLYLLWRAGGYPLLITVKALVMTLALFLLGLLAYRRWANLGAVAGLLAMAVLAPMTRIFPERPYVVTYALLPLCLLWLSDYVRSSAADPGTDPDRRKAAPAPPRFASGPARRLWLIPAVIVPWANMHPGFMVLFGFLGSQWLQDLVQYGLRRDPAAKRRLATLAWIGAASFAAGAVNPMGFGLYTFSVKILGTEDFMRFLTEWGPPHLATEPVFFAMLGLAWLAQAANWKRLKIADALPLLVFSLLALKSYRNIPVFLIAALPPLAENLRAATQALLRGRSVSPAARRLSLLAGGAVALMILVTATRMGFAFRLGEIPRFYPHDGLAWAENHGVQGRMLTHDIWGGFTGWATHGRRPIFIDGRFPTFGEKLYADYRKIIWGDPQACLPLLDHYGIEAMLISPKNDVKLFVQLWQSRQWALVYWDDVCLLYLRRGGANHGLIAAWEYIAVDPKHTPYFNPAQPQQALAEVKRAQAQAPRSFLPLFFEGDLRLRANELTGAREALQQTLRLAPDHLPTRFDLGLIAARESRLAEAEAYFREVIRPDAEASLSGLASYHLAALLAADPERRAEARRWAQNALRLMPGWEPARDLERKLQP